MSQCVSCLCRSAGPHAEGRGGRHHHRHLQEHGARGVQHPPTRSRLWETVGGWVGHGGVRSPGRSCISVNRRLGSHSVIEKLLTNNYTRLANTTNKFCLSSPKTLTRTGRLSKWTVLKSNRVHRQR